MKVKVIAIILTIILTPVLFGSCTKDDGNSCADYTAEQKIVYVGAVVEALKNSAPVDSVDITIEITYLPCGTDEADPINVANGYTDASGKFESPEPVTVIMENERDRVKFFAITSHSDFEEVNYAELYLYYTEISGLGYETWDLSITSN